MAYSFSEGTGNGVVKTFPFSFTGPDKGYFDARMIKVEVDGLEVEFTITGPTQVTLASAPTDGAKVRILRKPPTNAPYTDFIRGNSFGKENINRSFEQQLYITHRIMDGFREPGYYEKQDLSLGSYRIKQMADAIEAGDAVTKRQLDDVELHSTGGKLYADMAEASAIAAAQAQAIASSNAALLEDFNLEGNYITDSQNFPDLIAGVEAHYYLDGVNDGIVLDTPGLSFSTEMSVLTLANCNSMSNNSLFTKYVGRDGSGRSYRFYLLGGKPTVEYGKDEGVYAGRVAANDPIPLGVNTMLGMTFNNGETKLYKNGIDLPTTTSGTPPTVLPNVDEKVALSGGLGWFSGTRHLNIVFNKALPRDEMRALSNGANIPWKYVGASQNVLVGGPLIPGKEYRIQKFKAGDDFSGAGGENVTGRSFVASSNAVVWTNSSELIQVGCVLNLNAGGVTNGLWLDSSGNNYHAVVTGAIATNVKPNLGYKTVWVGAGAMLPCSSSGASPAVVSLPGNALEMDALRFKGAPGGEKQRVQFSFCMPNDWSLGDVKMKLYWTDDGGFSEATYVDWIIKGLSAAAGNLLDSPFGNEVVVRSRLTTFGSLRITESSGTIALAGTKALGSLVSFEIKRDVDNVSPMQKDAFLIGCLIQYPTTDTIELW